MLPSVRERLVAWIALGVVSVLTIAGLLLVRSTSCPSLAPGSSEVACVSTPPLGVGPSWVVGLVALVLVVVSAWRAVALGRRLVR